MAIKKGISVLFCAVAGGALVFTGITAFSSWRAEIASHPVIECSLQFSGVSIEGVPQVTTPAQMQRGLSGLEDVGSGMLFSWPDDDYRHFWMKGTPTPLSIAFIDAQGVVIQVEDMKPYSEYLHQSRLPVREALEVRQGDFQKLGISLGSRLISRHCTSISK